MRIEKVLAVSAAVLLVVLLAQLGIQSFQDPKPNTIASWKNHPKSLDEAKKLSDQIVVGKVTRIRRTELYPQERENLPEKVSIPAEVVTFQVEDSLKGGKPATIEVFRTGSSIGQPPLERSEPREKPPERPKEGAVERSQRPPRGDEGQARSVILIGDPPYKQGERYLLLLMDGPEVQVEGGSIKTKTPISPEGRYRLSANNALEPVSTDRENFAEKLRGRALKEIEPQLRRQ